MKKYITFIIFGFSILSSFAIYGQQIFFKMDSPRIYYDAVGLKYYFRYDLFMRASVSGTYLYSTQQAQNINSANTKFNVAAQPIVDISTGILGGTYNGNSMYTVNSQNWVGPAGGYRVFIVITSNTAQNGQNPNVACAQLLTTFQKFATVSIEIIGGIPVTALEMTWRTTTMTAAGVQKYAVNPLPANGNYTCQTASPSSFEGADFNTLYYARIYDDTYDWTQYGVAVSPWVDWSAAVNTSVWDTLAASAYILNAGSQAAALRIHPGARLAIAVGADLTCTGNTEINEPRGLWINSGGSGNGSFIDNGITYPVAYSGSARVERHLTACDVNLPVEGCWHYVSIPVTSAVAGVFNGDYMKSFDEVTGLWSGYYTHSGTPLNVMEGYAVHRPAANVVDTKLFTGNLNTACPAKNLTRTVGTGNGYNLVGNPYPSSIDIDNLTIGWNNVDKTVWYYDKTIKNYRTYPLFGTGATGSQYIPPMQGIFVHVTEGQTSGSLTFPNTSRVHNHLLSFYKDLEAPNDVDVLYLEAQGNGKESGDLASIVLRDYSTSNFNSEYDASKMYGDLESPQLYTVSTDGAYLTINTLPYAGRNTTVPLNFNVFENGTGSYIITASNLESFKNGTTIILEDKKETKTQELTVNPVYTFNYTNGDDAARFLLHFYNPFFGINDPGRDNNMLIYSFGHDVYVKDLTGNPEKGDFYLYDMMGKKITEKPVADISLNKYTFNLPDGYYIVRVITKDKTHNCKVYLD